MDRRVNAIRGDLADVSLAGVLFAQHYSTPEVCQCGPDAVMMHDAGAVGATAVSQLLPGEHFAVLEVSGGWAWGYSAHDHYVGYIPAAVLTSAVAVDHVVTMLCAPVFSAPDIKSLVAATLPMGARFAGQVEGSWLRLAGGHIHARHAAAIGVMDDWVKLAERLTGMPYLWGGRGVGGIDCSGLVQLALGLVGIAAPRDSDQQQALGSAADGPIKRGDLVFMPGHVGIMLDEVRLLHANAHWMSVVAEPLADAVARLPNGAADILARRRLT